MGGPGAVDEGEAGGDTGRQWPKWQYRYDRKPEKRAEFVKLLADRGQEGWEFAAVVPVTEEPAGGWAGMGGMPGGPGGGEGGMPGMMGGMGAGPTVAVNLVVFKRPATPPAAERPLVPGAARPEPGPLSEQDQAFVRNAVGAFRASPRARFSDVIRALTENANPPATVSPQALAAAWDRLWAEDATRARAGQPTDEGPLVSGDGAPTPVGGPPDPDRVWQFIGKGQDRINLNDPANARLKERMQQQGQAIPADGILTKEQFTANFQARMEKRTGAPGSSPPASIAGFQVIALKHAKAADVARTVRELYPEPQVAGGGPTATARIPQLVISADDARNLVLFRINLGLMKDPTEKTVRDLVAELDVPAK
jgi:hypothetical protein